MKVLIIDNYDSFTFNLYQLIAEVFGTLPEVIQNDLLSREQLADLDCDCVIVSPGPGRPENERDFGICRDLILELNVPILGVCLGHQGIAHLCGGTVVHAPQPMHGIASSVFHSEKDLFQGIPQGFQAVRYHSLIVAKPLPPCLEITAWTSDGIIMGLRHQDKPVWGVQFHPESICTEHGHKLLENFRELTLQYWRNHASHPRLFGCHPKEAERLNTTRAVDQTGSDWRVYSRRLDLYPDPETLFQTLFAQEPFSFWLDSSRVEKGLSRFSYMGAPTGPYSEVVEYYAKGQYLAIHRNGQQCLKSPQSIFDYLNAELGARFCRSPELPFDFNCGFVGYFGYELKAECGGRDSYPASTPDAGLIFADRIIVIDQLEGATYLVCLGRDEDKAEAFAWFEEMKRKICALPAAYPLVTCHEPAVPFQFEQNRAQYLDRINQSLQYIRDGESYEICLTNKLYSRTSIEPFLFYRYLRRNNPAPYAAFLHFQEIAVACSSPERFLKISSSLEAESKPIKGTLARGGSAAEDARLRDLLGRDIKSRAENLMIVDLVRNDLGRVCKVGSVHVPHLMAVETYATVHQLVSTIRGTLRDGVTAPDCFRKAFPGGSMTGAPKIRTMELIDQLEPAARGIYSGSIGFFAVNGSADLNIVIRTAVFESGKISIGTGGAIIALSDLEEEFEEIMIKARPLLNALSAATVQDAKVGAKSVTA